MPLGIFLENIVRNNILISGEMENACSRAAPKMCCMVRNLWSVLNFIICFVRKEIFKSNKTV